MSNIPEKDQEIEASPLDVEETKPLKKKINPEKKLSKARLDQLQRARDARKQYRDQRDLNIKLEEEKKEKSIFSRYSNYFILGLGLLSIYIMKDTMMIGLKTLQQRKTQTTQKQIRITTKPKTQNSDLNAFQL